MPQGWGRRISHHFLGRVYYKVLLRIFSGAVTTKEILDHPKRCRRKQEKPGMHSLLFYLILLYLKFIYLFEGERMHACGREGRRES